ncbi:MAG: glycosyltransferase family 4 protein [Peptostreptococcaceae bacterium]|nr:glycosyltransferase family 4 protein [Peptostreptococcaceae bacterium]
MKILITTDVYKPVINGVVISTYNLYEQLKNRGHDVKILTLSNTRTSKKSGDIYFIGSLPVRVYPQARMTVKPFHHYIKEIIKWKPDIIHTQTEFTTSLYARQIAYKLNIPMVHTYHTMYEDYTHYIFPSKRVGKKVVALFSKHVLSKADEVIVPTIKVLGALKSYGVKRDIVEIPTGIHLEKFKVEIDPIEKTAMKKLLNISEKDSVLVTIGRLGKEKNVDELINLMKPLSEEGRDIKLLIVGDGPVRKELEEHTRTLGLEKFIIFTGMVPQEDVHKYYHLGDIFISASTSETQGLTYIEAMASGLPLICRKDECLLDVVEDGFNGFTFENEREFIEKIELLMDDKTTLALFKKNAVVKAQKFSVEEFGRQVEELYIRVINKRRK